MHAGMAGRTAVHVEYPATRSCECDHAVHFSPGHFAAGDGIAARPCFGITVMRHDGLIAGISANRMQRRLEVNPFRDAVIGAFFSAACRHI